jgi:Putative zinc-finger
MSDPLRCAEVRELAPEVALGIAPAQDRARVLWHATACAACREALSELSALTDDVLALTREHEPPAGFETQVLARIGDRSPRRRRWRRVALFAAAIVVAALVSGVAVYRAQGPDRQLAASVRATLATAHGQYFATGSLHDGRGQQRGIIFGYQGDPAWIFVTVAVPPAGRYAVEVVTHAGVAHVLADDVDLAARGAWGGIIPVPIHEIAVVRVLDADGRPMFSGRFVLR